MKLQGGAALVVSLVLLIIALLLGLISAQSSRLEEAMVGNYRLSSAALNAAESGVGEALLHVIGMEDKSILNYSSNAYLSLSLCSDFNFIEAFKDGEGVEAALGDIGLSSYGARYFFCREDVDAGLFIASVGKAGHETYRTILAEVEGGEAVKSAFNKGLLSADYIRVTGRSTVSGGVHANGYVDIKLTDSSEASITSGDNGGEKVEVPLPGEKPSDEDDKYKVYDEYVFSEYSSRDGVIESCNISLASVPDGGTVFCEGSLVVGGGAIENKKVTIVAMHDVVMNGATSSSYDENSEVGLLVVAGGNIEFNGSTDNFGVFWAAGYVRQNGNSHLYGSIVAGDYIRSNGGVDFTSMDNITNPDLIEVTDPRLVSWVEEL